MNTSNLMQPFRILVRTIASRKKVSHGKRPNVKSQKFVHMKCWENDMVQYEGVKYYPRFPDHKDPEIVPTKLFLIQRIKPWKGQPYWDRAIMQSYGIGEDKRGNPFAIVKNTPTECGKLWKIKHLLKISAIQIPENFKKEDVVMGGTFLQENGQFDVLKKLNPVRVELSEQFEKHETKMDKVTIKRQLRYKWLNPIGTNP